MPPKSPQTGLLNTLKARGVPNVAQSNQTFMAKNPQFGAQPTPPPTDPTSPVGQKAVNPDTKIAPPQNTLPKGQGVPLPLVGAQTATPTDANPFHQAVQGNLGIGQSDSPEVKAARDELKRYQESYANASAGVGLGGTDFNYAQGTENSLTNQYQQGLASRTQAVQNALASQGQRIGALSSVGGQTQPVQVSPGNFYVAPYTGKDVSGGDINPFTGGVRVAGYQAGQDYGKGNQALQGARDLGTQFSNAVQANPDFNSGALNFGNAINLLVNNQYSNKDFPGIQSTFNNIISQYAQVLGGESNVISLIRAANAQSMQSLLKYLDDQATAVNESKKNFGGVTTPLNPSIQGAGGQAPQKNDPLGIR